MPIICHNIITILFEPQKIICKLKKIDTKNTTNTNSDIVNTISIIVWVNILTFMQLHYIMIIIIYIILVWVCLNV
jgi:predicted transcriptional regulator